MRLAAGLQDLSPGDPLEHAPHRRPPGRHPRLHGPGAAPRRPRRRPRRPVQLLRRPLRGPLRRAPLPRRHPRRAAHEPHRRRMHAPPPRSPIPPWLRRVLLRGLATDPERRWPDMRAARRPRPRPARRPAPPPARRRHRPHHPRRPRRRLRLAPAARRPASRRPRRPPTHLRGRRRPARRRLGRARSAAAEQALLATGLPYAADTWARVRTPPRRRRAGLEGHVHRDMSLRAGPRHPRARRLRAAHGLPRAPARRARRPHPTPSPPPTPRSPSAPSRPPPPCPRAAACADPDAQQDLLHGPTQRGEIEALRQSLARANAQLAAGRYAEAKAEATRVAEAARTRGEPGLTAEALHRVGMCEEQHRRLQGRRGDPRRRLLPRRASRARSAARRDRDLPRQRRRHPPRPRPRGPGLAAPRPGDRRARRPRRGTCAACSPPRAACCAPSGELEPAGELAAQALALLEQLHGPATSGARAQSSTSAPTCSTAATTPHAEQPLPTAPSPSSSKASAPSTPTSRPTAQQPRRRRREAGPQRRRRAGLRAPIAIREASFGERHPGVGVSLTNLGELAVRSGQHARAEVSFRRAAEIFEAVLGPDHPNLASALGGLGRALVAQDRLDEARPLHLRAQRDPRARPRPGAQLAAFPLLDLASLELAADNPAAAIAPATRALELRAEGKPEERAEAPWSSRAPSGTPPATNPARRTLAAAAELAWRSAGPGFQPELDEVITWRRTLTPNKN
jgi:tetratricopeptide (TPR) repeat protein